MPESKCGRLEGALRGERPNPEIGPHHQLRMMDVVMAMMMMAMMMDGRLGVRDGDEGDQAGKGDENKFAHDFPYGAGVRVTINGTYGLVF